MPNLGLLADAVRALEEAKNARRARGLLSDADVEALAKDYPEVGPPVLKVDKKKGTEYPAKNPTDLESRLLKERDAIRKDMEKNGYTPMFPVEDRFYVDPSNYPRPGDTQVDAVAKNPKNAERKRAQFDTPEARSALQSAYAKAKDDPMARRWYAMGQLEQKYVAELGEKAGRQAFQKDFADAMAATTGGADPTANLLMAHYGNVTRERGRQMGKNSYDYPSPIGGRYVSGNMETYDKVINQGQGLSAAEHPKRHNFSGNFLGHLNRATIDEQMSQGMTGGALNAPPKSGGYGAMESVVIDEAKKLNVPAAELQDVAWAGFKGTRGKPMISHYNDAIERTSRILGIPPADVLRGFIRKELPMYGSAGTAMGLGLLVPADDRNKRL